MSSIKKKLLKLQAKIEEIKLKLHTPDSTQKDSVLDSAAKVRNEQNQQIVTLSVGGTKFSTFLSTLGNVPDTLFTAIISHPNFRVDKELYFERSPVMFRYILNYLRTGKVNFNKLHESQIHSLFREAYYYELADLAAEAKEIVTGIKVIGYEVSEHFTEDDKVYATCSLEELANKSLKLGGICTEASGWIIFTLNSEWEINEVIIGPYITVSLTSCWKNSNGKLSSIYTSTDKQIWNKVGTIPSTYSSKLATINFKNTTARYIKIQNESQIGVSYFRAGKSQPGGEQKK